MMNAPLTRRQFLNRSVALATTAAALRLAAPLTGSHQASAAQASNASARPQLSACIEAVFTKAPFEQRLDQVKAAGLRAFEFWGWRNRDLNALANKMRETELELAAFSCDPGGALVAPGSKDKFIPALRDSLAAAKKLHCRRLIVTVGNERKDLSRAEQRQNIVEALKAGAPICEEAGITLVLEPLNVLVNHKGYYLATSAEGFQIIDEVGSPNVLLLFDIYHQQITEGNLTQNITRNIARIGHFHVADVPGRHQPGTGEIHYGNLFRGILKTRYSGFLGLEMWPTGDHATAVAEVLALFREAAAHTAPAGA